MRRACWHCEQSPAISNVGFSGAIIFIDGREAVDGSDDFLMIIQALFPGCSSAFLLQSPSRC
jgi:hypothetical protein